MSGLHRVSLLIDNPGSFLCNVNKNRIHKRNKLTTVATAPPKMPHKGTNHLLSSSLSKNVQPIQIAGNTIYPKLCKIAPPVIAMDESKMAITSICKLPVPSVFVNNN